jgi:hypothetical protein
LRLGYRQGKYFKTKKNIAKLPKDTMATAPASKKILMAIKSEILVW